jgi:hypothetical protein
VVNVSSDSDSSSSSSDAMSAAEDSSSEEEQPQPQASRASAEAPLSAADLERLLPDLSWEALGTEIQGDRSDSVPSSDSGLASEDDDDPLDHVRLKTRRWALSDDGSFVVRASCDVGSFLVVLQ